MKIINADETHPIAEIEGNRLPLAIDCGNGLVNIHRWGGFKGQVFALVNSNLELVGFTTVQEGENNLRRKVPVVS